MRPGTTRSPDRNAEQKESGDAHAKWTAIPIQHNDFAIDDAILMETCLLALTPG
jgi:hypothetical protein